MTIDQDDPKWTAYVLGELAGAEREELERVIAADPEARAYVASLRDAVRAIEGELQAMPAPALHDLQRQRIANAAAVRPSRRRLWIAVGGFTAAAASAVIAIGLGTRGAEDRAVAVQEGAPAEYDGAKLQMKLEHEEGKVVDSLRAPSPDRGAAANRSRRWNGDGQLAPTIRTQGAYDPEPQPDTEAYSRIDDNPFHRTAKDPLSTFSIDVDTASYANVRRFLESGTPPPKDAVRVEELINYFEYDHPAPQPGEPFSITTEVGPSPWNAKHKLVRIGLHTADIDDRQVPARNLVFLVDTSGSMNQPNKLPLLVESLGLLVDNLRPQDRVSIVVYAGAAGIVLDPTSSKSAIRAALAKLHAGGSTNGGAGIELAYRTAARAFIKGGINRVILCSDGDYNVGITSEGDLTRLIERERERGVFLTVLGFGRGNYKDATMEKLADRGNGNYAYIDSLPEARKVLVQQAGATLVTVAKDVKIQVELNPATVAGYRLIGYENRILAAQDFNDDKKDAGEIGAGHSVTALYEIVPAGVDVPGGKVDDLKYQTKPHIAGDAAEYMTVKVRYKAPDGATSKLLSRTVETAAAKAELSATSVDFRWASAIAAFGMLLRESPHRGQLTWHQIYDLAEHAVGQDAAGYRRQALQLIDRARSGALRRP